LDANLKEQSVNAKMKSGRDVIIRTENWQAAIDFYQSTLGLKMKLHSPGMAGFETGSFCLYVEQGPPHGPVFDFYVPDVATAKAQLLAAGCVLIEEDPARPRCYLRDPFGITFNIAAS
jgi:catechol 2,3-dioxygenase-like lactoylglutathione lyase family enzyme